jgi:hypothetical protein
VADDGHPSVANLLPWSSSPLRRSQSGESTSRRGVATAPRRGLPHPRRSAFAVSHDLDGLRLPEPCGVFHPLTPLRFVLPVPRLVCPVDRGPKTASVRTRGAGARTGGSRSAPSGRSAEASRPSVATARTTEVACRGSGYPRRALSGPSVGRRLAPAFASDLTSEVALSGHWGGKPSQPGPYSPASGVPLPLVPAACRVLPLRVAGSRRGCRLSAAARPPRPEGFDRWLAPLPAPRTVFNCE